jgi:hypothetical protein
VVGTGGAGQGAGTNGGAGATGGFGTGGRVGSGGATGVGGDMSALGGTGGPGVAGTSGAGGAPGGMSGTPGGMSGTGIDTGVGGSAGSGSAGAGTAGGGGAPSTLDAWYEAEAVPPNVLINGANKVMCNSGQQYNEMTCTHDQVKEGAVCCSEGGLVANILGKAANNTGAGIEFHNVSAPTDGVYSVTWWYHCGASDTFGDVNCGGLHYSVPKYAGCRPHLIDVNGTAVSGTVNGAVALFFQFPCYSSAWAVIHAATTDLPLKAGNNVIFIHTPHVGNLDAADIDAIHVTAMGQGNGVAVTPVVGNGEN